MFIFQFLIFCDAPHLQRSCLVTALSSEDRIQEQSIQGPNVSRWHCKASALLIALLLQSHKLNFYQENIWGQAGGGVGGRKRKNIYLGPEWQYSNRAFPLQMVTWVWSQVPQMVHQVCHDWSLSNAVGLKAKKKDPPALKKKKTKTRKLS